MLQRTTLINTNSIGWHLLLSVLYFMNSSDNYMFRPLSPSNHQVISYKNVSDDDLVKEEEKCSHFNCLWNKKQWESCVAWKICFLYLQILSEFQKYDHNLHIYGMIVCQMLWFCTVGICYELLTPRMKDTENETHLKKSSFCWRNMNCHFIVQKLWLQSQTANYLH